MIQAIVLDLDGVLIRPWGFRDRLESEYGIGPEVTSDFFMGPFKECSLGKLGLREALPSYLAAWGWPGSLDELIEFWFQADSVIDEGVLKAVRGLRGQGTLAIVASTQEALRAQHLASHVGLGEEFDRLFFSCELRVMKPDPHFYQAVADAIRLPGDALLFFDDDEANVEAARTAGWHAQRFTDYHAFEAAIARYLGGSR